MERQDFELLHSWERCFCCTHTV